MSDIHLIAADVRVMRKALDAYVDEHDGDLLSPETASDIDRAKRLSRVMGRYNVTEEVNDGKEAQHEAPEPRPVLVQEQSPAGRDEPVVGPDPVGRQAQLVQALRNLKALNRTPIHEEL